MIDLSESKTYRKVLAHREKCGMWGYGFCLECFGGGLTQFTRDLEAEFEWEFIIRRR